MYVNQEDNGILRFCVYVETDNDTDNDGKADLVKTLVEVPRSAAEGVYKAAAIYDPTPYAAGTYLDKNAHRSYTSLYVEEPFNYDDLYRECEKRIPDGELTTLEHAETADPAEWIYTVPISGASSYPWASEYDYYLVRGYGSWLWQYSEDQYATNGDYGHIWEESDYAKDWEGLKCPALVVHGLNDFNVETLHSDKMVQALSKAGQDVKLVLHQNGHDSLDNFMVNGELWQTIMNRWLAHYLYDIDNGAEDMPAVLVQSNLDGSWSACDSWRDFNYIEAPVSFDMPYSQVTSANLNEIASRFLLEENPDLNGMEHRDAYYMALDREHIATYPVELPENTTVYGAPEIHVHLSNENYDYEGLRISAVLIDQADDGKPFPAYMIKNRLSATLPVRVIDEYDIGGEAGYQDIYEFVQDYTNGKAITYGYTDLADPGKGYDISEYTGAADRNPGAFYDYTFYMDPTVYTVRPGHHLVLYLTTWDPYRAYLDRDFVSYDLKKDALDELIDYSFTVDNESIRVMMPVKP